MFVLLAILLVPEVTELANDGEHVVPVTLVSHPLVLLHQAEIEYLLQLNFMKINK